MVNLLARIIKFLRSFKTECNIRSSEIKCKLACYYLKNPGLNVYRSLLLDYNCWFQYIQKQSRNLDLLRIIYNFLNGSVLGQWQEECNSYCRGKLISANWSPDSSSNLIRCNSSSSVFSTGYNRQRSIYLPSSWWLLSLVWKTLYRLAKVDLLPFLNSRWYSHMLVTIFRSQFYTIIYFFYSCNYMRMLWTYVLSYL